MHLLLSVDPTNPTDLAVAAATIDWLQHREAGPESIEDADVLRRVLSATLRGHEKRIRYVRVVAEAGAAGAPAEKVAAVWDGAHSVGGGHSSLERAWRGEGGGRWSHQLIDKLGNGRHLMAEEYRTVALEVADELEASSGSQ